MVKIVAPAIGVVLVVAVLSVFLATLNQNKANLIVNACRSRELTGEYEPSNVAYWLNQEIFIPLAQVPETSTVLGSTDDSKWVEVDLSDQTLKAHQGDNTILETKISSGKFNRTPTGEFRIWIKLRYTKMEGGKPGTSDYYYLPNVPYTMFFYNDKVPKWRGFGLHGTYWHNNFGQPMSHGCVNLPTDQAKTLFEWTDPQMPSGKNLAQTTSDNPGTRIVIHE